MQSYEKVYAPFDGVITARQTDVGALIDGDSSPKELFHLAAIDKLRVFVPVPEVNSAAVRTGEQVTLTSDQFPNRSFHGTLVRDSSAIDPGSRTLNVEVDVDNPDRQAAARLLCFRTHPCARRRGRLGDSRRPLCCSARRACKSALFAADARPWFRSPSATTTAPRSKSPPGCAELTP